LIDGIEASFFDEAFGQAKRHGRVICPFSGLKTKRTASNHVVNGLKCTRRFELQRGADGIADCETEQSPAVSPDGFH
jgi:hypothetical protein